MPDKYDCKWALWFAPVKGASNNAITLGQTTYFSCSKEQADADPSWHRHEDCHKKQWAKDGVLCFSIKYLYWHLKYGYNNNPYEVEAVKAESLA